jgi:hypothetical protein
VETWTPPMRGITTALQSLCDQKYTILCEIEHILYTFLNWSNFPNRWSPGSYRFQDVEASEVRHRNFPPFPTVGAASRILYPHPVNAINLFLKSLFGTEMDAT